MQSMCLLLSEIYIPKLNTLYVFFEQVTSTKLIKICVVSSEMKHVDGGIPIMCSFYTFCGKQV
jgi:hypothetical protein